MDTLSPGTSAARSRETGSTSGSAAAARPCTSAAVPLRCGWWSDFGADSYSYSYSYSYSKRFRVRVGVGVRVGEGTVAHESHLPCSGRCPAPAPWAAAAEALGPELPD